LAHIYCNKFGTKRHQNHRFLLKHIFTVLSETQHACACLLRHISLNVIIIISNIYILNAILYKV